MLTPGSSIHVIGACGTAMATFCAMLAERGHRVRGSDQDVYPPMSDFLRERGIEIRSPYAAENLEPAPDLVVVGNAIHRGNPEMAAALDRGLRFRSFPEVLRDEFLEGGHSIVISGTHGKTTTAAMTGVALQSAGLDPSILVGGYVHDLAGSFRLGDGPFVIEGDEYDTAWFDKRPKFLHYLPRTLVINNLEFDHADIYDDLDAITLQFRRLVKAVPDNGLILVGDAAPNALVVVGESRAPVERFGLADGSEWRATELVESATGATFTAWRGSEELGPVRIPLSGAHNVRNALAAVAVSLHRGTSFEAASAGLGEMHGIRRRLEVRGETRGVLVYDDFAHHPTAIGATLRAVRARHPERRVWGVFEPRSWTSRRNVHQEALGEALGAADRVILAEVFEAERLPKDIRLDAPGVVAALEGGGTPARLLPGAPEIAACLAEEAEEGDVVVVMSNGGFGGLHELLLKRLAG